MKSKKKIKEILRFVPNCKTLNDVGCDHGYLGVMCLKAKICEQVVFSDISSKSLEKAKKLVLQNNLNQYSLFDVCNGISSIENKYDVVAVLGLGGDTIQNIIRQKKAEATYFLLQPMTHQVDLRKYLINNGYILKVDEIIEVNSKFYDIILAQKGRSQILDEKEILFGLSNIRQKNKVFKKYLLYKSALLKKTIANMEQNMLQSNVNNEHQQLLDELALMQSLIKES